METLLITVAVLLYGVAGLLSFFLMVAVSESGPVPVRLHPLAPLWALFWPIFALVAAALTIPEYVSYRRELRREAEELEQDSFERLKKAHEDFDEDEELEHDELLELVILNEEERKLKSDIAIIEELND